MTGVVINVVTLSMTLVAKSSVVVAVWFPKLSAIGAAPTSVQNIPSQYTKPSAIAFAPTTAVVLYTMVLVANAPPCGLTIVVISLFPESATRGINTPLLVLFISKAPSGIIVFTPT